MLGACEVNIKSNNEAKSIIARTMTENELTPRPDRQYSEGNMPDDYAEMPRRIPSESHGKRAKEERSRQGRQNAERDNTNQEQNQPPVPEDNSDPIEEITGDNGNTPNNTPERRKYDVNNIEELARLITLTDPGLWGKEGKFPLLETVGTEEQINQSNFLLWVRERMLWHHDNDSDEVINLFSLIEVSTGFQRYGMNAMLANKGKFFRTGKGIDLTDLHEQVSREVWLFNTSRNNDIEYKSVMHSDKDLSGQIKKMYYKNTFTKNAWGKSTLRWIMTLPEQFKAPHEQHTGANENRGKSDVSVGEGVRTAYLIYYHLSDTDQLEKMLGKKTKLLSRKAYQEEIIDKEVNRFTQQMSEAGEDVRELSKLKEGEAETTYLRQKKIKEAEIRDLIENQSGSDKSKEIQARWLGSRESGKSYYLDEIFDKDGNIHKKEFNDFINIFTGPETNSQNIAMVRKMVKNSIQEIYYPDEKTAPESVKTSFGMPSYAEQWAHSMLRWSGAAARNDTGARSYDKWTELQLTYWKRIRDTKGSRAGGAGNPYNMALYKALSPNLLNGIVLQDDKNTTPFQVLTEIENARKEMTEGKKDAGAYNELLQEQMSRLEFTANAMNQFASVHLDNAFKFLEILMDAHELDFEKYKTKDIYGRIVFDKKELQDGLTSFFKIIRNGYSTWSQINFDAEVRVMVDNSDDPPTYETKKIAEMMFGKKILDGMHILQDENGQYNRDNIGKLNTSKGREELWKQIVKGYIAAQIRAHRDLDTNYRHYGYHDVETIYEVLELIPKDVIPSDDDISQTTSTGHAFDHHDIEWIRDNSKTKRKKMFWIEMGAAALKGVIGTTVDISKKAVDGVKTK